MFASKDIFLTRPSGYQISRSVRFRESASAYLSRTFGTPTNNNTWTFSAWMKRGSVSSTGTPIFVVYVDANNYTNFTIDANQQMNFAIVTSGVARANSITSQVFRDPAAWYHVVLVANRAETTESNRIKMYINGVQVTAWATAPTWNNSYDSAINGNGQVHRIGNRSTAYFDGYLTEINFIDGQALTPSSFGETNSVTGVWQPKKYAGTYGTNGFYLNFSDNSGVTATTIGKDYSGNGNNWTPNNISVTAGATYDSMLDVPTPYADGGNGRGNYCTLNPLTADSNATFSQGNLTVVSNTTGEGFIPATIDFDITSATGYYFEVTVDSGTAYSTTGFIPVSKFPGKMWTGGTYPGQSTYNPGFEIRFSDGTILQNGGSSAYGSGATAGDTWGFAIKNGKVWARNSSGWFNSGNPVTETNPAVTGQTGQWLLGYAERAGGFGAGCTYNFGQRPFTYTPPTGFVALNTQNLPTPTISNGANYMAATAYSGTGATQSISNAVNGVSFQPDFVWMKKRSAAESHILQNSITGVTKYLLSNSTAAEDTSSTIIQSFDSGGFTAGISSTINGSSTTYVAWQWNAGGSTVTNTSGTISSQVRANATAGFSIVTYTGTSANATVGHGLNATPAMIIVKNRDSGAIGGAVYHTSLGATKYLKLFQTTTGTDGEATDNTAWNGGSPTFNSSVFSVGSLNRTNSSQQMVAYCFAAVAGYSAFGSYTGNGAADGVFVYLGFRPRFIMIKSTSASTEWVMIDTSRSSYNLSETSLYANRDYSESTIGTVNDIDILSNGFKLRNNTGFVNASQTYIYAAFSEVGFKYALGR